MSRDLLVNATDGDPAEIFRKLRLGEVELQIHLAASVHSLQATGNPITHTSPKPAGDITMATEADEVDVAEPSVPAAAPVNSNRLSIPFVLRLPILVTVGGTAGGLLGLIHGANESGLRFRAENAHRLPTTQTGWYLYHKSKNYVAMLGGIKEGVRMAGRQAFWVGVFVGSEEGVDRARGAVSRIWSGMRENDHGEVDGASKDFVSTVFAGLGTAGLFSAWHRFPIPTAARLAKTGAKAGLAFGLLQDIASMMRGRRLGYVDFVKKHVFGVSRKDETYATAPTT
jgi:hypothetical protein